MNLHDATADLHHACHRHPVGQRMAEGGLTPQEWADWLGAFRLLHSIVDCALPGHMERWPLLSADLAMLPRHRASRAALVFGAELLAEKDLTGAGYVLHGAHRSGGRMMAPKLAAAGLPCAHIAYPDQAAAQEWVRAARERVDMAEQARATFACLLAVMDEIGARRLP